MEFLPKRLAFMRNAMNDKEENRAGSVQGERRVRERRCPDLEPYFPCVDFEGRLIHEDRRRVPDRRARIQVEWLASD
jgi:hypothetical protein